MIAELDTLLNLNELLATVTDAQIKRLGQKMKPKEENEQALGTIHDQTARKIYTLGALLTIQSDSIKSTAPMAADDEEEKKMAEDSLKAKAGCELCKDIFWYHLHLQFGHWDESVGLRHDWMAVSMKEPSNHKRLEAIKRLFGGAGIIDLSGE